MKGKITVNPKKVPALFVTLILMLFLFCSMSQAYTLPPGAEGAGVAVSGHETMTFQDNFTSHEERGAGIGGRLAENQWSAAGSHEMGSKHDSSVAPVTNNDNDSAFSDSADQEAPADGKNIKQSEEKGETGEKEGTVAQATAEEADTSGAPAAQLVPGADPFTGSASFSYPIMVPPGRAGMAPNLVVRYSSAASNSWLGVGWDLDMGYIQRSTKKGVNYDGLVKSLALN